MAKKQKAYFGFGYLLSLILCIIPVTGWILGTILRVQRGNIIGAVLCFIFWWPIFWIIDVITMITDKDVKVLA